MRRNNFRRMNARGGVAGSIFSPSQLALTGWYRDYPTFTGTEPWVSSASAGPSGGRTLYHGASSPTSGSFLNGHQTATFDGAFNSINSQEGSGQTMNQYISATAWSAWALVNAASALAPSGNVRNDPGLFDDSGGTFWQINYNTDGMNLSQVGNSVLVTITRACSTLTWHLVQSYYDGTNIGLRVDSGAWVTAACGNIGNPAWGAGTNFIRIGDAISGLHFAGQVADVGWSQAALSLTQFDQVKAYVNSRYALTL